MGSIICVKTKKKPYNLEKKDLIKIKKEITEIEKEFSKDGKRQINLDLLFI